MKVIIPKNQSAKKGEYINVHVDNLKGSTLVMALPCETDETYTASYDEVFYASDYDNTRHGFGGITQGLDTLVQFLNNN